MAAGGAASSRAGFTPAPGSNGSIDYRQSYVMPSSTDHGTTVIAGVQVGQFYGPGTFTSVQMRAVGVAGIGFSIVLFDQSGNPTLGIPSSIGTQDATIVPSGFPNGWLTYDQTIAPLMSPQYVYPVQEVVNNAVTTVVGGNQSPIGFKEINYATASFNGPLVFVQYGAGDIPNGSTIGFASSFANGTIQAGAQHVASPNGNNVYSVTYTYYNPIPFGTEARVYVSPAVAYHDNVVSGPNPFTVSLKANVAFG